MIKANLKKNVIEVAGNDMDYLSELMVLTWELKERYPELRGLMKESFDTVMNAKERPIFESEENFTRSMRELFGATNEPEEPTPLDEEDIEYLFHKIKAAKKAGNHVSASCFGDSDITIYIMRGAFSLDKKYDANFSFCLYAEDRGEYDECIAYLKELAGEENA